MFEDYASVFDLGDISQRDKSRLREDIGMKKKIGKFSKEIREITKQETCYYCGNKFTSFCNSHSIPAFVLRNIAENGEVLTLNAFIDNPIFKVDKGVNQAGTFNLICRNCDSKIFSEYENPENYCNVPTQKMLGQIALKNNLMAISKRMFEINLYDKAEKELGLPSELRRVKNETNTLDLNEYIESYKKAKKSIDKNSTSDYYLCYYEKLNYVVPIAFQGAIALIADFNGNIINNIYNMSPEYKVKNINICVFPLQNETAVFMFIESGDKRYRNFYRQFNKLDRDDRLLALTYIMLSYSEEVYFSKRIEKEIFSNEQLQKISRNTSEILSSTPFVAPILVAKEAYDLSKRKLIPNLLLEKYKIN